MSPGMFGLVLLTLVLSPLPWMFHHWFLIEKQARRDGQWTRGLFFALLVVFTVDRQHPQLRRSKWIVLLGCLYFVLLAVAWGTYKRHLGI
jgi:CDP-diglyceride synthetase